MKIQSSKMTSERCGGCGHTWANHDITTKPNSKKIKGKCKKCGCVGISLA